MWEHRLTKSWRVVIALGVILAGMSVAQVSAQMSSGSYQVNEAQFGSGSSVEQCSGSYCSNASLGDLTNGSCSSTNYAAQFGFNTTDMPLLEVSVNQSASDMGVISTTGTGKVSSLVTVRSYLSNGYIMQITGRTPNQGTRFINPMGTADDSLPGTEQFGINLTANTTPAIGADPVQVPSGEFSYGVVNPYYATANKFKYVEGDVVASSATSSGQTNYTISMIMNISNNTPGGQYAGKYSAVVTPMF